MEATEQFANTSAHEKPEDIIELNDAFLRIKDRRSLIEIFEKLINPRFKASKARVYIEVQNIGYYDLLDTSIEDAQFTSAIRPDSQLPKSFIEINKREVLSAPNSTKTEIVEFSKNDSLKAIDFDRDIGFQRVISSTLVYNGEDIGFLVFYLNQSKPLSERHKTLIQKINQLTSASAQDILDRVRFENEKTKSKQLLGIAKTITSLQEKDELLKAIYQQIKPVFPYDEYGLFVLTKDKEHHYELVNAEIMNHASGQVSVEKEFGAHALYPHADSPVEDMMNEGPGVFLLKDYMHHSQGPYMYNAGFTPTYRWAHLPTEVSTLGCYALPRSMRTFIRLKIFLFFKPLSSKWKLP